MMDKNKLSRSMAISGIAVLIIMLGFATWVNLSGMTPIQPADCWLHWLTNASDVTSKVHVWNLSENSEMGSCDMLKDLCYTIQINHANSHLDYNCRWFYESDMFGNSSCVCSHANIPDILNVTIQEE